MHRSGRAALCALLSGLTWLSVAPSARPSLVPGQHAGPDPMAVVSSPARAQTLSLPSGARLLGFDVSPRGDGVALLVDDEAGSRLSFWTYGETTARELWRPAPGMRLRGLVWHTEKRAVFVIAEAGNASQVLVVAESGATWQARQIYTTAATLRRVVMGPVPFVPWRSESRFRRLFFGVQTASGTWVTRSITEDGEREYQVIGPPATRLPPIDPEFPMDRLSAPDGLPLSVHPSGGTLLWSDSQGAFHCAQFGESWEPCREFRWGRWRGGTLAYLPNGLGVYHWQPGRAGVEIDFGGIAPPVAAAGEWTFETTPSFAPDGGGLVGIASAPSGGQTLRFVPLTMPLADVCNAWQFATTRALVERYDRDWGMFRPAPFDSQLYGLYERELYTPPTVPGRPTLVTTDLLWDTYAAAYEGLFMFSEQQQAIPEFWRFVGLANTALAQQAAASQWARTFRALSAIAPNRQAGTVDAPRMAAALAATLSSIRGAPIDPGELEPRGHYVRDEAFRRYFMAVRGLVELTSERGLTREQAARRAPRTDDLRALSADVQNAARRWTSMYTGFVAPPRGTLVFGDGPRAPAPWVRAAAVQPLVFPLGWGFDNEVLERSVVRPDEAPPGGALRLLPSGLDLAAAMGNSTAAAALADVYERYPQVRQAHQRLRALWSTREGAESSERSLYERWLDGLANQWLDSTLQAMPEGAQPLWAAKRLQSGLASWATLRHATVLANERPGAEGGEGGAEFLDYPLPKGWVEPDERTFLAIADLFEATADRVASLQMPPGAALAGAEGDKGPSKAEPMRAAVVRRLTENAAKARAFAAIARKEVRGETLAPRDYDEIRYAGRFAEHQQLVFRSLTRDGAPLANPESMAKIVDVVGTARSGYLEAAVGTPLEWHLVAPFFGRRQIVVGTVYSYFERTSRKPLTDAQWREEEPRAAPPDWIRRFSHGVRER